MRVLITVKAAPNPSVAYGETVCVAALRLDLDSPGWVRLYPINFRDLESTQRFRKYEIVTVAARPARADARVESWRPDISSLQHESYLAPWKPRKPYVEPYVVDSMCAVLQEVRDRPPAKSLALVCPKEIYDLEIQSHPGWTPDEQAKIDAYVNQLDMFGADRTPLEAPRYKGWYLYRCHQAGCKTHRQGLLDWEFVAFQRRLYGDDSSMRRALRARFLEEICAPTKDVSFYVGNQAKHWQTFSVLGAYYPNR